MSFLDKKVQDVLVKAANNVIEEARSNLKDGPLKKSLKYKEKKGTIEIIMEEYGVFYDKGVSGANNSNFKGKKKQVHKSKDKFSFKGSKAIGGIKSIDRWMSRKGIAGGKEANFLIRRSIAQHGIKPSLFLTKPYEKYLDKISAEFLNLAPEIVKDIRNG